MSVSPSTSTAKVAAVSILETYQKSLTAAVDAAKANGTSFAALVSELAAQMAQKSAPGTTSAPTGGSAAAAGSAANSTAASALSSTAAGASPAQNNSFFYGYNGQAYSLAPPTGDSFLASNGQTYTKQQIKDFYARNPNPGDDIAEMAKLGLKFPDLYKARALAGKGDGTGIYTDPKEMTSYHNYLRSAMPQAGGVGAAMSFDQWRNTKDPSYLASLQTGPIDNIGWINGPVGGVAVGGTSATSRA